MGLLDFFGKKSGPAAIKKHATRVANKRAQATDRWESFKALREIGGPEAAEALLPRFGYKVDPTISDRDEKDYVVSILVEIGEPGIPAVRAYLSESDSIAWPLRVLTQLVDEAAVVGELLTLAEAMSTDYERFPEKKIQVLAELEERRDPRIADATARFLDDMNETARYHAVGAVLLQENAADHLDAVIAVFVGEESARIRAIILDRIADAGLAVVDRRDEVEAQLPSGYALRADGKPSRT